MRKLWTVIKLYGKAAQYPLCLHLLVVIALSAVASSESVMPIGKMDFW